MDLSDELLDDVVPLIILERFGRKFASGFISMMEATGFEDMTEVEV